MKKDYFEAIIKKDIEEGQIAGASLCVVKDGISIYDRQFGYQNLEEGLPMMADTIFRLYSMTKPITATALMILVERGVIDLFEPVSNYLEAFSKQWIVSHDGLVQAKRQVTIKDLLNMTSGVVYPGDDKAGSEMGKVFAEIINDHHTRRATSLIDIGNKIGSCPLAFEPGSQWQYGASVDVLGAVIEAASKMSFGSFLRKELFEPLDMTDTGFYVPKEKWYRFAQNYVYDPSEKKLRPYKGENLAIMNYREAPIFESGGAGLVSTVGDYLKFTTMLLNKGSYKGIKILGSKTIELLTSNQLSDEQKQYMDWEYLKGYGYGNCMRIMEEPSLAGSNGSVGEFGWDGWTGNYMAVDPKEGLIFLYFIQRIDTGTSLSVRKLKAVAYGQL
jgi:CubicO group peptidase (beta-lactamase class C family)